MIWQFNQNSEHAKASQKVGTCFGLFMLFLSGKSMKIFYTTYLQQAPWLDALKTWLYLTLVRL